MIFNDHTMEHTQKHIVFRAISKFSGLILFIIYVFPENIVANTTKKILRNWDVMVTKLHIQNIYFEYAGASNEVLELFTQTDNGIEGNIKSGTRS